MSDSTVMRPLPTEYFVPMVTYKMSQDGEEAHHRFCNSRQKGDFGGYHRCTDLARNGTKNAALELSCRHTIGACVVIDDAWSLKNSLVGKRVGVHPRSTTR